MPMKRILLTAMLTLVSVAGFACTNLIVGKLASTDGSVMCTYNCDGFGFASSLSWSAAGRHAPGEMISLRGFGPFAREPRHVAQVDYTYGVVGLMNELQVSIVETTWDGREELAKSEGALDYFTLMDLALQRSASAHDAVGVVRLGDIMHRTFGAPAPHGDHLARRVAPGGRPGKGGCEAEAVAVVGAHHASVRGSQFAHDEVRTGKTGRTDQCQGGRQKNSFHP